jgi:uncharacterized protein
MKKTLLLPDVNVWLAMTFDSHIHHPSAKTWFDGLTDEQVFFCRMTQQGFLRLATNPQAMGKHALTLNEAWQKYDIYMSDSRIAFTAEPANIEAHWRTFAQGHTFSPSLWNDAYLAAFALAGGYDTVTFDTAFASSQAPVARSLLEAIMAAAISSSAGGQMAHHARTRRCPRSVKPAATRRRCQPSRVPMDAGSSRRPCFSSCAVSRANEA